jgi:hypothetical protein
MIASSSVDYVPLLERVQQPLHSAILEAIAQGQRNLRSATPRTIGKVVAVTDCMVREKCWALEIAGLIISTAPMPGTTPEAYLLTDAGWARLGNKPMWME